MFPFWYVLLGINSERAQRRGLKPMRAGEVLQIFAAGFVATAVLFGAFWLALQA